MYRALGAYKEPQVGDQNYPGAHVISDRDNMEALCLYQSCVARDELMCII